MKVLALTKKDSTDYLGNLILKNNHPSQYLFEGGYASFDADTLDGWHYYVQDYMGNNRMVVNVQDNSVEQETHYYPYGGVIGDLSTDENLQAYKFENKELDRTFGLDWYDIQARQYDAIGVPSWNAVDPLAEKYYGISPYVYCAGDPVNRGDYDGMADYITSDGNLINRDNNQDGKLFVLKTTQCVFPNSYGKADGNGISMKEANRVVTEGDISNQNNFIEITGSQEIRSRVLDLIEDDGTGGEASNNNREYLVNFSNGETNPNNVCARAGEIGDPSVNADISVSHGGYEELTYIHSHPSGTKKIGEKEYSWYQAPSATDIQNGSKNTSYVVAASEKLVYIYNNSGILGTVKLHVYQNYKVGE